MIASGSMGALVGLASGIVFVAFRWTNKLPMPKLEDLITVAIAGIGIFSGIDVGVDMFHHDLTGEQLAVIELGCLSLVYVSFTEIHKRLN